MIGMIGSINVIHNQNVSNPKHDPVQPNPGIHTPKTTTGPFQTHGSFRAPTTTSARTEWQWNRPWRCLSLGSYLSDVRRHAWKTSIPRWARYNRYPSLNKKPVERISLTPPPPFGMPVFKISGDFWGFDSGLRVLSKLVVDTTRWNDATSTWSKGSWNPPAGRVEHPKISITGWWKLFFVKFSSGNLLAKTPNRKAPKDERVAAHSTMQCPMANRSLIGLVGISSCHCI